MARLAKLLAGDWTTTEQMEHSSEFPNGGSRHGVSHVRLAVGGSVLVYEGQSNGSAGPLHYMITFWWDKAAGQYRLFTCFRDTGASCKIRGTAHWKGDTFVNDYEEIINGKPTKLQDIWDQFTPTSRRLVMSIDTGGGTMKPLVTTFSKRR